jgi:transcriptional regulator with XRE-family HTH domain
MESNQLGERLRQLREQRGISLRELGRLAETAPASLSAIENGHSSPTLATLNKLLKGLGTDFATFFAEGNSTPISPVFPASGMRKITDANRTYTLLFPKQEDLKFEVLRESIAHTEGEGEWEAHDCDMGGMLVSGGPLRIDIEGLGSWTVKPGDAFYVRTRQRHRAVNTGDAAAELITVFDPPRY